MDRKNIFRHAGDIISGKSDLTRRRTTIGDFTYHIDIYRKMININVMLGENTIRLKSCNP
jgi:hypothetical protein